MQYTLVIKEFRKFQEMISLLSEHGYAIRWGLDHAKKKDRIIGICIDVKTKDVYPLNVTFMVCWSKGKYRPLYCEEILGNFEKLIFKEDYDFYLKLVEEASKDDKRPIGYLFGPNQLQEIIEHIEKSNN